MPKKQHLRKVLNFLLYLYLNLRMLGGIFKLYGQVIKRNYKKKLLESIDTPICIYKHIFKAVNYSTYICKFYGNFIDAVQCPSHTLQ